MSPAVGAALEFYHSPARYLALRGATATRRGARIADALAGSVAPLRLSHLPEPTLPGPEWVRIRPLLSGICGSDLGLLTGRSSPYLGPLASMPFVPGHEVVAETVDATPEIPAGTRVVLDPVLSCQTRSLPACRRCRARRANQCDHIAGGVLSPGLQTGFCADTGGGWGRTLVAHESRLHVVPDDVPDRCAVLAEPLACALHSVRRAAVPAGASVLVVGAGTVGLLTLLALRTLSDAGPVFVAAKHAKQRELAKRLGATEVLDPARVARSIRLSAGGPVLRPDFGAEYLLGGVDAAFECTGGATGLDTALRTVRAGGTVVMSGMPSGGVDLTPLWFRELSLIGSYASLDDGPSSRLSDFTLALSLVAQSPLDEFVDAVFPLSRWREAVGHALHAGRLGTVKVAFDPRRD